MPLCNRFTILDSHVLPDVGINSLSSVGKHALEEGIILAVTGAITSVELGLVALFGHVVRVGKDC
jgi:hypothetical protein